VANPAHKISDKASKHPLPRPPPTIIRLLNRSQILFQGVPLPNKT